MSRSDHGSRGEKKAKRADQDPQAAGWCFYWTIIPNISPQKHPVNDYFVIQLFN